MSEPGCGTQHVLLLDKYPSGKDPDSSAYASAVAADNAAAATKRKVEDGGGDASVLEQTPQPSKEGQCR